MTWGQVRRLLCPEPARRPAYARGLNIGFRTVHIAVTGILCGGHAFSAPAASLRPVLWAVIASGTGLVGIDSYKSCDWVHQGWGVMLFLKLALLCLIPFCWEIRLPILLAVVVLASVESHMPSRFRHYSLLYRRVMKA
jgi:hypothetical protein